MQDHLGFKKPTQLTFAAQSDDYYCKQYVKPHGCIVVASSVETTNRPTHSTTIGTRTSLQHRVVFTQRAERYRFYNLLLERNSAGARTYARANNKVTQSVIVVGKSPHEPIYLLTTFYGVTKTELKQ